MRGPVRDLRGELDMDLEDLRNASMPPTSGSFRLRLGEGRGGAGSTPA